MKSVSEYDLTTMSDGTLLSRIVTNAFKAGVLSCQRVGRGFYGHVYRVDIDKPPYAVIVKCHQFPGRAYAEVQQLAILQKYALVKLPLVYSLVEYSEAFPCDAIIMELIPGINAAKAQFPDARTQQAFVQCVTDNLHAWHNVHNAAGFGDLDGPFSATWTAAFGTKVRRWRQELCRPKHQVVISDYVFDVIDQSVGLFDNIFAGANSQASLVHSDYNAWNMLVDPDSFQLTGVIDPLDAGWADPEIDLFHLPNCRPELGLLQSYLHGNEMDDAFWLRFYFYRFWDDIKHYLRMGWYQQARFTNYAHGLEEQMQKCL